MAGRPARTAGMKWGIGKLVATASQEKIIDGLSRGTPTVLSTEPEANGLLANCVKEPCSTSSIDNTRHQTLTRLTQVSHSAPTRLIPIPSSPVRRAGAALCAVSSYGGGMLRGDRSDLNVDVGPGATLGVITQGCNRIYRSSSSFGVAPSTSGSKSSMLHPAGDSNSICRASLTASIGQGGLLVWAPDPTIAFTSSSFAQDQRILADGPEASVVLVDWFGAGRVCNGERWDVKRLSSRLALHVKERNGSSCEGDAEDIKDIVPFLVEAFSLDSSAVDNNDPFGFAFALDERKFDAFASIVMHGPAATKVAEQCKILQRNILSVSTRIRYVNEAYSDSESSRRKKSLDVDGCSDGESSLFGSDLARRIIMSVSRVGDNTETTNPAHVVRIVAVSNEDMYRVLHSCLLPLKDRFGMEFYRDRITAASSAPSPFVVPKAESPAERKTIGQPSESFNFAGSASTASWWRARMLADSGLPTGGFAHSSGLEAASQLGVFGPDPGQKQGSDLLRSRVLGNFVWAATRSATRFHTPFVVAGHEIFVNGVATSRPGKTGADNSISGVALLDSAEPAQLIHRDWLLLDRYVNASLNGNAPAYRASLTQGSGLLRVAMEWLGGVKERRENNGVRAHDEKALQIFRLMRRSIVLSPGGHENGHGHIGPILGMVGASLGLSVDECSQLLGFTAARDMISAAVRLNLIGPMAGVSMLDRTSTAVKDGIRAAKVAISEKEADEESEGSLLFAAVESAAASAPVVDTIHPCHDILSVRLFRT